MNALIALEKAGVKLSEVDPDDQSDMKLMVNLLEQMSFVVSLALKTQLKAAIREKNLNTISQHYYQERKKLFVVGMGDIGNWGAGRDSAMFWGH